MRRTRVLDGHVCAMMAIWVYGGFGLWLNKYRRSLCSVSMSTATLFARRVSLTTHASLTCLYDTSSTLARFTCASRITMVRKVIPSAGRDREGKMSFDFVKARLPRQRQRLRFQRCTERHSSFSVAGSSNQSLKGNLRFSSVLE